MSKKAATYGMLVALAFLLSYVETWIPLSFAVPGVKLGLANLVTLVALYSLGEREACGISLVRIVLVGVTFANLSMMIYSLAGGLFSLFCMVVGKRYTDLSKIGVSVLGGITHNLGQILLAVFVLKTESLFYYVPALLLTGTIAGFLIGLLGGLVVKRIAPFLQKYSH